MTGPSLPDKDSEAVESLRALAAWLDLRRPEPDIEDRAAVRARWDAIDKAGEMLGELAGWDDEVLRQAVGPILDEDKESPPGRSLLVCAAVRAEQMKEPLGVTAQRLAHSALLGALVVGNQRSATESEIVRSALDAGEDLRAGWVTTLAGNYSSDPVAALVLAQEAVEVTALVEEHPQHEVDLARALLSEAEVACRGDRP